MNFTKTIELFLFLFTLAITNSSSQSTTSGDVITITKAANVSKPGCQSQCGILTNPYPFGIGPGCFLSEWYETTCNTSFNPPRTQIGGLPILEFTDNTFRVLNKVASRCYNPLGNITENNPIITSLGLTSPFSFSQKNQFFLIGCDDVSFIANPQRADYTVGCIALCFDRDDVINGSCSGVGCCQTSIPKGFKFYSTSVASLTANHTDIWSFNPCGYSFLGEQERFTFNGLSDPGFINRTRVSVPMLVDWVVGNSSCSEARTLVCWLVKRIAGVLIRIQEFQVIDAFAMMVMKVSLILRQVAKTSMNVTILIIFVTVFVRTLLEVIHVVAKMGTLEMA